MSMVTLLVVVVCVLALGLLYAVAGSRISAQWLTWIRNALLAAGGAFAVGMLLLGLPGAVFVEAVTDAGRKLPPDSEWPLAIMTTMAGALMIVPASLVLRVALPAVTGWLHALATTVLTSVATLVFVIVMTQVPAATPGPESLSGQVLFDYPAGSNRIVVGSGARVFTLHFSAASSRSVMMLNTPSDIDRIAHVKDAHAGQTLDFRSLDSTSRLCYARSGDHVLLRNTSGYFMQVKIMSVKSKSNEGDARDEVIFEYQINESKSPTFSAL